MRGLGRTIWQNGPLLMVLACLTWGTNSVLVRGISDQIHPIVFVFGRMLVATLIVWLCCARQIRADWAALKSCPWLLLILGITGNGGFNLLIYVGLQTTTALNSLLMQSVIPVFILLCALVLFRERPALRQVAAILVSLVGVAVIVARGDPGTLLHLRIVSGDAWIMLAMVLYGFYSVLLRRLPRMHPMSFLFGSFAMAAAATLPAAVWETARIGWMPVTPVVGAAVLYVAIFPAFLGYLCYNRGIELMGSARGGHFLHLSPVFGSLLAVLVLGESFHVYHVVGVVLIAAGLLLANRRAVRRPAAC